jgi:anti-anti-sigma factor
VDTSLRHLDPTTDGRGDADARGDREALLADTVVLALSDRTAVLVLLGEHDLVESRQLRAKLMNLIKQSTTVIVDVSHAKFIGSTLLHTLIDANKAAGAAGGRVVLQTGYDRHVHRLVQIVGLAADLDCVSTREEALKLVALRENGSAETGDPIVPVPSLATDPDLTQG